jgi:hypothetical protein
MKAELGFRLQPFAFSLSDFILQPSAFSLSERRGSGAYAR